LPRRGRKNHVAELGVDVGELELGATTGARDRLARPGFGVKRLVRNAAGDIPIAKGLLLELASDLQKKFERLRARRV
jgi:hypothetical protein